MTDFEKALANGKRSSYRKSPGGTGVDGPHTPQSSHEDEISNLLAYLLDTYVRIQLFYGI